MDKLATIDQEFDRLIQTYGEAEVKKGYAKKFEVDGSARQPERGRPKAIETLDECEVLSNILLRVLILGEPWKTAARLVTGDEKKADSLRHVVQKYQTEIKEFLKERGIVAAEHGTDPHEGCSQPITDPSEFEELIKQDRFNCGCDPAVLQAQDDYRDICCWLMWPQNAQNAPEGRDQPRMNIETLQRFALSQGATIPGERISDLDPVLRAIEAFRQKRENSIKRREP